MPLNVIEFHPNALEAIRKFHKMDQPGRIDEAIDMLDEWVQKQDHFTRKDFSK